MGEILNEKFGGKTLDGWQGYINTSLKKTVESTLDSAARIAAYKNAVPPDVFKKTLKAWYGFGEAHLSYWSKIAENADLFKQHVNILPASPRSLYELAAIDRGLFDEFVESGKIKPSLTVEGIKSLKTEGGKLKSYLFKFADSPDYLEICKMADTIKKEPGLSADEVILKLAKWVKEEGLEIQPKSKPKATPKPVVNDDDDDDKPFVTPEGIEVHKPLPKAALTRATALQMFGIYLDKPLDNLAVERALTAQAGDDDELLKALEVILS